MPLPVIANTVRCALTWTNTFSAAPPDSTNVIHVRTLTEDEEGIANTINSVLTAAQENCLSALSAVFQLTLIQTTLLDGTSGANDWPITGPFGQASGDFIPQGACVVSLKTGGRGPQARGRIYLGPVAESQSENGSILDADEIAIGWNDFKGGLALDGVELVVASYEHSVARSVTSCSVHPFLRTQRRRAIG